MDARLVRAAILVAATLSLGANYRSQNFIVSAATPQLAAEICSAAENYRRDLAIEWLGQELPPWRQPCPITAQVSPQLGAGGATSFMFDNGMPFGWTMTIQGSRERVLDSVLPHEVTHTIFATHFGRPLPRWADEGACTTVEDVSEKSKQDRFLIEFLKTDRGIPFNKMFAMREYPRDILPLYSQGYSLARFLIQQGGKQKFVQYVGDGMASNNWPAATRNHYGFNSLSDLQVTWVEWVRQGSPNLEAAVATDIRGQTPQAIAALPAASQAGTAQLTSADRGPGWQTIAAQNARTFAASQQHQTPAAPSHFAANPQAPAGANVASSNVSRPVSEGWYAKQRDQAQQVRQASPAPLSDPNGGYRYESPVSADARSSLPQTAIVHPDQPMQIRTIPAPPTRTAIPASTGQKRVLMEWSKGAKSPQSLALNETGTLRR